METLIDIGNTNIVFAITSGEKFLQTWRIFTDQKRTSDEYYAILLSLINKSDVDIAKVDKAVVSSVVPNLTRSIVNTVKRLFHVCPIIVTHDIRTGLRRETIPPELGTDLLCNMAYAHHKHADENVMVVDFGTALTFSTVKKDGSVMGVSIVPGLITSVNALFAGTAQLPQVELKIPERAMGRNSEESIRSGIMFGYAGLVGSIIGRTEKELGEKLVVMATGGLSMTIRPLIKRIDEIDKLHTLKGLKCIAELN